MMIMDRHCMLFVCVRVVDVWYAVVCSVDTRQVTEQHHVVCEGTTRVCTLHQVACMHLLPVQLPVHHSCPMLLQQMQGLGSTLQTTGTRFAIHICSLYDLLCVRNNQKKRDVYSLLLAITRSAGAGQLAIIHKPGWGLLSA